MAGTPGTPAAPDDAQPSDAPPEETGEDALKPSAMRGNEMLYGYVVAAELIAVAVANLVITHGKGAPSHPERLLSAIAVALSVGFIGLLQTRHRMVVGFGAIVVAYFVTIPRTPTTLSTAHLFALVIPVVYAIVLTQRQRKATLKRMPPRKAAATSASKSAAGDRRSRKAGKVAPTGPQKSSRYTPPKAKRARR